MNKKILIILIIAIVAILGLFLIYQYTEAPDSGNRTTLNVSSEGPIELSKIVTDIKTNDYYEGYDNETVVWMESLGNKYVFTSTDEIVIMDKWDANKIPSVYACDVSFYEIFSANVIEKHSLGNCNNSKDVLYVKNVDYIREEAHYYDV